MNKIAIIAFLIWFPSVALAISAGMFNVYLPMDEAMGYRGVDDDIAEVSSAGITLFHHYFQGEHARDGSGNRFWSGLSSFLSKNPDKQMKLTRLKAAFGPALGWNLFFWESDLDEVRSQTSGKGGVIIGEMYSFFAQNESWDDLAVFVNELCRYEQSAFPNGIAGWYVAEEPNSPRKRYDHNKYEELVRRIRSIEEEGGWRRHPIYVDLSPGAAPQRVIPFVRSVDVVMISPDAYIWAAGRPRDMSRYDLIPYAISRMRAHLDNAGNRDAKIHVVLQAYQSPTNLQMHQQIRQALVGGWYIKENTRRNVAPPDGVWFWWWHEAKASKGRQWNVNRWDDNRFMWKEAISSELSDPERKQVVLHGEHRWEDEVFVIGDVVIADDAKLIVEPGTIVRFSPIDRFGGGDDPRRCELIVKGELWAEGYSSRPIKFTSGANVREFSYPPKNRKKGDWYGIIDEGKVTIKNCQIEYALHEDLQ